MEMREFQYIGTHRARNHWDRVNPRLLAILGAAAEQFESDYPGSKVVFSSGFRSEADQTKAKAIGASGTLRSPHMRGDAVDILLFIGKKEMQPGHYTKFASIVARIADLGSVPIVWGRDFKTSDGRPLHDIGHFEVFDGRSAMRKHMITKGGGIRV